MVRANAEPGTGTQIVAVASPPQSDDDLSSTFRANGVEWLVGHDYFDTEIGDMARLVQVIRRSSWCDTRDPEEAPPKLIFEYERYEYGPIKIDPNDPSGEIEDRFIERYERKPRVGAPASPW